MSQDKIYSVAEITRDLKRVIRASFGALWIEGEISGYKKHTSGHHYFTLKDSSAQLSCAMWKLHTQSLDFSPQDGLKVQVWGNLDVYEPAGRYQFMVMVMRRAGVGELQRAFDELVRKLKAEGLFDLARKRKLPRFPEAIGLITSKDGAALQDMRTVAARRWPAVKLILAPVRVQGTGAAQEIAAAIEAFNRTGGVDMLVVGRGGGSLEDLWAFNEEIVARAIYASRIPVVSAIGHEVDVTIADFVADVRAPTPSAAMEIVLPDCRDVATQVGELKSRLNRRRLEHLRFLTHRLAMLSQHWALREPIHLVAVAAQRVDDLHGRLRSAASRALLEKRSLFARLQDLLLAFGPEAILTRGYAVVRDEHGAVVRDGRSLRVGSAIAITLARGRAEAEVISVSDDTPFPS